METNVKHTPGPWNVNKKYSMSVEAIANGQGVNLIAECCDPDGIRTAGEDQANARLIAAAPSMLSLLERLDNYLYHGHAINAASELHDAIRAAIAKAEGH